MKQRIPSSFGSAPAFERLVFFTAIFLLSLALPYPGHAAEPDSLRSAVANILEREGFATGTADKREQRPLQSTASAFTTAGSDVSAGRPVEEEAGEANPARNESLIVGLMVIFADEQVKALSHDNLPPPSELTEALEDVAGVALQFERPMSLGGFVFSFDTAMSQQEFGPILQRLRQLDSVERIAGDALGVANFKPSDRYINYQWSLYAKHWYFPLLDDAYVSGINALDAWDITTGSKDTVVAVLDTGLIESAPIDSSRLLPGYDFITNQMSAGDGDARDGDPTDAGDYRLEDQCLNFPEARDSSWHGTAIASIIAEEGDDGAGIAGINWQTSLLPVRVLGKCGAFDSDVIDGMLWAAGFPVPGTPDNVYPADIINLSLGGFRDGGCNNSFYPQIIADVMASGSLIIAAVGNEDMEAEEVVPGNCEGVITVGATDHLGNKASYSNWSHSNAIEISAPGGDSEVHETSRADVVVPLDEGNEEPTGELAYFYVQGTSVAAPHVAGVASLAMGLDPEQHPQVIASVMALTAQPFAEGSDCEQEFPLCGLGIVDARATLEAVEQLKSYQAVGEFYHEGLDHYFRTGNWDEIDLVLQGRAGAWEPTGDLFLSWRDGADGALPVCRFYGTPGIGPNSHFYTVDPDECELVKRAGGWTYEGVPFYSKMHDDGTCPPDTMPVYRYYNQRASENDANHRFATHLNDQAAMEAEGWMLEGVAMCAPG